MKLSLRSLIAIPLVVQVVVITATTGFLAYRNDQRAIEALAHQILEEADEHLDRTLTYYTQIPSLITQENLDHLALETLDSNNLAGWYSHLYRQIQRFPDITYIYYGNTQGDYVEISRLPDGELEFALKTSSLDQRVKVYPIDGDGELGAPQPTVLYDPRERPWYGVALNQQQARWTDIYDFEDPSPTFGISFVRPHVVDSVGGNGGDGDSGDLQGILGADFTLRELELFLANSQPSRSSISFLMNIDGKVLASSEGASSFKAPSVSSQGHLPLVQAAVEQSLAMLTGTSWEEQRAEDPREQQFQLQVDGAKYWGQITPFSDGYGLRWAGITLLPETDFTEQIQAQNRNTLILCILAMGLSSGVSLVIARIISRPIQRLGLATQEIADHREPEQISPSPIQELNLLIRAFNLMGARLEESRSQLKTYSQRLEELVEDRTQDLRRSQETFAQIFHASPNAITLTTLDEGRYIQVNDRFVELVGIARDDIIGRTNAELNAWVEPQTREVFRQELAQGRLRNQEWALRKPSGEIKQVLLSAEVIHFQKETCILVIANDIGERIAAQEQLRQSEERWQLALRGNNDGIWDWHIASGEVFYSSRWKSMLGYGDHEIACKRAEWQQRLHPEDKDRVLASAQAHLRQETPFFSEEYRLRCKDGSYKWILDRGQALWDPQGKPVRMAGSHTDISDRKHIEETLRRSQASLATAQRIAHVGNWKIDLTTHTAHWSPELLSMFGFAANAPTPSYGQVFRRIHPDERTAWKQQFHHALNTGEPQETDFRIVLPGGDIRYIEGRMEGSQDRQGRIHQVFGTALDITERKRAEATIQQQEQFLRSIYNSVETGIVVIDVLGPKQFRYIDSNAIVERMAGASKQQLLNATPEELFPPETAIEIINKYQSCVDRGETLTFEATLFLNNHQNRSNWWLITLTPLHDPQGRVYRIISTALNITKRKTTEAELAQQFKSEQVLTSISNQIRKSLDTQQTYQTTVDQIGLEFGVSRCCLLIYSDESTPQLETVAEYLVPEYGSRWDAAVPLVNNPHIQAVLSQDEALVTQDVTEAPLLQTVLPQWQPLAIQSMMAIRTSYQGKPNGVIEVHQCDRKRQWLPWEIDLLESVAAQVGIAIAQARLLEQEKTQRRALYHQNIALESAIQAAEQASQVKGQFLANMSHELRTPLNAIVGFAQIMQRTLKHNPSRFQQESAEHLQIIQTSSDHLLTLINDILDMAKIEAGQMFVNPNTFDLHSLLESIEAMFQPKAQEKELTLRCEYPPEVPQYIQTDEAKLRQILINLVGNAVKFTHRGTITIKIWGHQTLHIAVQDTGQGISPDELDLLFNAFYQTEAGSQSQGGTGLGLSISQTYVKLLGGQLSVQSALHHGSIFQFSIPVTLISAPDTDSDERYPSVIHLAPNQPSYRILVVEDQWASRTLLTKLLDSVGFDVREAANGQAALKIWEEWQPQLIWMDMHMPVMDGYEATQQIRAYTKGQGPAIIALTASALESEKQRVLCAGCDDFVRKPFQDNIIFEKLQRHLGVEYIYAQQPTAAERPPAHLLQLSPQQLGQQPQDWIKQLHSAASLADAEWVCELVHQLPLADDQLAQSLSRLVKGFRCDLIAEAATLALKDEKT